VPGPTGQVAGVFTVSRKAQSLNATREQGSAPWRLMVGGDGPFESASAETDRCSVALP
jgi:hypothetical protein